LAPATFNSASVHEIRFSLMEMYREMPEFHLRLSKFANEEPASFIRYAALASIIPNSPFSKVAFS
jgi:hypothetical protein